MKRFIYCSAIALCLCFTGCQALTDWYTDNKDELYHALADRALIRLDALIDADIDKLVEAGKIAEDKADEVKAACKQAMRTAFVRIDDVVKNYKTDKQ